MAKNTELSALVSRIKYEQGLKQADVAKRIGVAPTYLSDMINGRVAYSDSLRKKLIKEFKLEDISILNFEPEQEKQKTEADFAQPFEEARTIPLLPLLAQGGKLNDFVASYSAYDCEQIISPIRDAQLAITVSGESMAPEYPAGSVVLVKRIDERKFIEWGRAYIIDTANGVVIKYLAPSDKGEGYIRCISLNPEPRYAPFDIALSDVFGVYRVLICMSIK